MISIRPVRLVAIGATACTALEQSGGAATVLAPLSASIYCRAAGEIVWLGTRDPTLHPRAMLAGGLSGPWTEASAGAILRFEADGLAPWRPPVIDHASGSRKTLLAGTGALVAARVALGPAKGFGALLGGGVPSFPLHATRDRVLALARACHAGDAEGAAEVAITLLGLGTGLTPSGDDLVGGAFFARALLDALAGEHDSPWREAAEQVLAAATSRTHPISVALLSDMLHGRGHAPLHVLASALASAAPCQRALDSARTLTRLGHCSGWDMLTGFLGGVLGARAFR